MKSESLFLKQDLNLPKSFDGIQGCGFTPKDKTPEQIANYKMTDEELFKLAEIYDTAYKQIDDTIQEAFPEQYEALYEDHEEYIGVMMSALVLEWVYYNHPDWFGTAYQVYGKGKK